MIRIFKYKLRPHQRFVRDAEQWLDVCRELYNAALQERREAWRIERKSITKNQQRRQLTEIRALREDVQALHYGVEDDALRRLDNAMKAFFRRCKERRAPGFPRFQGSARYNSLRFPKGRDVKVEGDRISFSKLGSCRLRLHRPIEGKIKTTTLSRRVDGWYVAFACEIPKPKALPQTGLQVGVDVGLESFATLSTGEHVANPRFLRSAEPSLKKAHRRVSRLKPRGSNRRKVVRLLALRSLKIQRQRLNFAHHIANDLIKRFDTIVIENLNIKGLVRNHNLAKSISDAGWSIFTTILAYKAENAGRELVKVNPAYTSQVCSGCGLAQKLKLSQRRYVCACGIDLHRDHNAAINILASASPVGRAA